MCDILVGRVGRKEFTLAIQCRGQRFLCIDVLLTPVHDTDEPEFERVRPSGQDIVSVCSRIHEVKLGKDSDGSTALWVYRPSELERFRVCEVDICSRN